jgi:putative endonuclease
MYYVYAIKSLIRDYIYVGITKNIERRLIQHNKGLARATRPYKPFELFFAEKVQTRIKARKKEKYLKSGCGKEFLKDLLN